MRRTVPAAGREEGFAMVMVLGLIVLLSILAASMISVMQGEASRSRSAVKRDAAYQAAEAGVDDYISKLIDDHLYLTHFVHPGEATRLATTSGRLVGAAQAWLQTDGSTWTYPNGKNNWYGAAQLGNGYEYDLEIFPQSQSSPLIRIVSTGRPAGDTDVRDWRELETLIRASSVSDFQMVADADITYGTTATTYGKIYAGVDANNVAHSVRHDGTAYGDIYAEGSVSGATTLMNGAKRYDATTIRTVIRNKINFNNFLASLVDIRSAAGAGGIVEDNPAVDAWWLTFQPNGQVWVQSCLKNGGKALGDKAPVCGAATPIPLPANGAIYVGQSVIVSGTVNGRVTVGSAGDIYPGGTLTYFQSGDDVLGLVASHSVIVPQWAPTNMSWRAATIAQSGTFRSYGYDPQTNTNEADYVGNNKLSSMTFTGSTATYGGGSMALFATRTYQYDTSLLYLPPPWFPTLQDAYTIVLSRELAPSAN
jgi:type II secretory pathway pseudopilin PulG